MNFHKKESITPSASDVESIFRESCSLYYETVFKYCICVLCHEEDAKDCTQETFAGYYKALLSGTNIINHHAYILKIARNICSNKIQQRERYNKKISIYLKNNQLYAQLSLEEQFDNDVIDGKIDVIAQRIIDSLNSNEKSLYFDYFINRLTAKQIANKVHESPTSISKKIKKLKKKIIKLVKTAVITEGGARR